MKLFVTHMLLLLAVGMGIAGCTGSGGPSAPGDAAPPEPVLSNVLVWTWEADVHQEMFESFMRDHPQYVLERIPVESDGMVQRLQTTLASGGQMPDLTSLNQIHRGNFLAMDIWEDISKEPYGFELDKLVDALLAVEVTPSGVYVGPDFPGLGAMCYKRDLARTYLGTDDMYELEALLPDWEAFIAAGRLVQERSDGQVFMMPSLYSYSMINRGQTRTPYFIGNQLNLREALGEAFATMLEMKRAGTVDALVPNSPEEGKSYAEDRHIFYWLPNWGVNGIVKVNDPDGEGRWGFLLPPGGPFTGDGACYAVPKTAENKEGAVAYILYICQTIKGAELLRDIPGSFSPYQPTYEIQGFYDRPEPHFGGQNVMGLFIDRVMPSFQSARVPTVYDADFEDVYNLALMTISMSDAGELTPQELITSMERELMVRHPELRPPGGEGTGEAVENTPESQLVLQ